MTSWWTSPSKTSGRASGRRLIPIWEALPAFRDKTGRLRQSIWIYRSKYKDGGYVVYVKAPHSHLVEFGHEQIAKDGKTVLKHVPGKHFLRKARNAVRRKVDAMLQDMMGDPHYGKRR